MAARLDARLEARLAARLSRGDGDPRLIRSVRHAQTSRRDNPDQLSNGLAEIPTRRCES